MRVKKFKIALLVLLVCVFSASLYAEVTKDEAKEMVINQILAQDIGKVDIYQSNDLIGSTGIHLWDKYLTSSYSESWAFFVDDMYFADWEHPCRYIFIDAESSSYQIVDDKVPPRNMDEFEIIESADRPDIESYLPAIPDSTPSIEGREPNDHLYAVLINGGVDDANNHLRYWNHLSMVYCALTQVYGYKPENIYVHSTDGTAAHNHGSLNLDGPDHPEDDIEYPATKSSIESTFNHLDLYMDEDDQLFVFVTDHGGSEDYISNSYFWLWDWDTIRDDELADMVEPFNCAEMIFLLVQCYSGGFIDDLEAPHRVVHTSCRGDEPAIAELHITYLQFSEYIFYWSAAARGCYPFINEDDEVVPWEPGYAVDEFPFENYPTMVNHPDPYDPNLNGDVALQMEEACDYANNFDTWSPYGYRCPYPGYNYYEHPQSYHNIGFQEDLLSLYGLCGNVANTQTVTGNFIVSPSLTIGPEVTLTIDDYSQFCVIEDASVTLFGRSLVEINNNSWFRFYEGSSLYGTEHTNWVDTDTGMEYDSWAEMHEAVPNHNGNIVVVPGDRIIVNDAVFNMSGTSDNPVTITSVGDGGWDGIEINNSYSYPGNHGIIGGDVSKIGHIKLNNSRFGLSNTTYSHCGQISAVNNSYLSTWYCTIDSIGCCPIYCVESKVAILNSTIRDNMGTGIYVYLPSDTLSCVQANLITSNYYGWGIYVIDAPMYIINNSIIDNMSHGFVSYGAGGISILAGNTIADNGGLELAGLYQWPDITSRIQTLGPNTIYSHDNGGVDHYLLGGPVEGNDCRGNDIDISDTTRFLPFYSSYIFDGEKPPEKILYEEGVVQITDGEYESAKLTMKEIVSDYPETETAISALQWLLYLEKFSGHDYAGLRAYIENVDDVSYPHFERIKNKIITSTYMFEKDYLTSIDKLEAILANPPSVEDSILALIDEGYCYLKLDEQGGKAAVEECTFKPRCFEEFRYVSQNLTGDLLDKAIPQPEPSTGEIETLALYQNYPNPVRTLTTISFSATDLHGLARIKIYNIKGQLVKEFSIRNDQSSIVWNGKDSNGNKLSNGIYLYKLDTGEKSITKKMVILR